MGIYGKHKIGDGGNPNRDETNRRKKERKDFGFPVNCNHCGKQMRIGYVGRATKYWCVNRNCPAYGLSQIPKEFIEKHKEEKAFYSK